MFTPLVSLHFNVDDETATVVDLTAYSPTIDFNQVGVVGTFTVTDYTGTAVISGGTIDISGGDTESAPFDLPLDLLNGIVNGNYTLVYTPTFSASGVAVDSFAAPDQITIGSVNWVNIFNESGATNQIVISGAPTPSNDGSWDVEESSFAGGDTTFTVDGSISSEGGGGAVVAFNVTYTTFVNKIYGYTGCDAVTPSATVSVFCNTTQFGQIIFQDATILPSGQVLDSLLWNISYPGNLTDPVTPPDVTSTDPTVTIGDLATGTWTWRLTYSVTVTQSDGLIYTYTASSEATEVKVTCTTLCSLRCGIDKLIQQSALAVNGGAAVNALTKPTWLIELYLWGATLAQECGNQTKFDEYAALIQEQLSLAGVDCDCGCDGESSTGNHWINNAGYESETVITELVTQVQSIAGFADALAGNISATAAYDAIVAQILTAFTNAANFNAQLGVVYAALTGLNPNDENFDDAVDLLEAQVTSVIDDLDDQASLLDDILADIADFNTDFPTYNTLFDESLDLLGSVNGLITTAQTTAGTLLTSLQSLTPINFEASLGGLLASLATLQSTVNSLTAQQTIANMQINGIGTALNQVIPVVLQNQSDIATLQSQSSSQPLFSAQANVAGNGGTPFPGVNLPAQYFNGATVNGVFVKGYVSIKVVGSEISSVGADVIIWNQTTSQNLATIPIAADATFVIDLILQYTSGNNFVLSGYIIETAGTSLMTVLQYTGIPLSTVLIGQINKISVSMSSSALRYERVEVMGIKQF